MLRVSRLIVVFGMLLGMAVGTHALAAKDQTSAQMQSVISTLQQQIKSTSDNLHQALTTEHKNTQQAVMDMHKQIQAQVEHLQGEIQQVQANLSKQIKMVQDEVQQVAARTPASASAPKAAVKKAPAKK